MKTADLQQYIIYTIGHGNRDIETLIGLLKQNDVGIVVDVRSIPYSRFHPQFRQQNLKNSLEGANIDYLWLGEELGGRPNNSGLYEDGIVNYSAIRETAAFKAGIQNVLKLLSPGTKLTLLCSESDPNQCHRKHLIADEFIKASVQVKHINKTGELDLHISKLSLFV